jgi:type IV fimbrial biogenesis protein FimT
MNADMRTRRSASRVGHSVQRGFTMIELMVVITILTLAIFVAVPQIGAWTRNTQVRNAAESLQLGLQRARAEAVRRNEPISLWLVTTGANPPGVMTADCALSAASASWVVAAADPSSNCTDTPSTTVDPRIVEAHGIADGSIGATATATNGVGAAANVVTFNGFGRVANAAAAIAQVDFAHQTGSDHRRLRLTVSPSGSVRLCDRDITSNTDARRC